MSTQVANLSLASAVVGTAGAISLGSVPPPTLAAQMQPKGNGVATLLIFNESGCGLTCLFPVSHETFTVPAGAWKQVEIPPGETALDYSVSYVLQNAPVSQLFADLYLPGETLDSIGNLGNSPIGLSGSVQTSVTQVIQDGQGPGQTIMESTPSGGGGQTILVTTDGKAKFSGALSAGTPITLLAGNQETGYCGGGLQSVSTSIAISFSKNFKTVMTNQPSSITLTAINTLTNIGAVGTNFIRTTGFNVFWTPGAGSTSSPQQSFGLWSYTTVGNCIRAVDMTAGTFDHHCDHCGHVRRGLSISRETVYRAPFGDDPGVYSLSVAPCPMCGSIEMLTTELTGDAERVAAPTPGGESTVGEQSRYVRLLQRYLGLAMLR